MYTVINFTPHLKHNTVLVLLIITFTIIIMVIISLESLKYKFVSQIVSCPVILRSF